MKYSFDTRVGYSEIAENGYMTPGAIVDRFQDCSNFQSEHLGVGLEYLIKHKRAWILNSWHIVFERPLKMGDNIRVYTWAHKFDKMFGYRDFMIEDADGNRCAAAVSRWMLMDIEKMRLLKITDDDAKIYGEDEGLDIDYGKRKLSVPDDMTEVDVIKIRGYQIDTNGHMNNGWYIKVAADYIDKKYPVADIHVEYRKAAMCGDEVVIKKHTEDKMTNIVMCGRDDVIYSVIEIRQKE